MSFGCSDVRVLVGLPVWSSGCRDCCSCFCLLEICYFFLAANALGDAVLDACEEAEFLYEFSFDVCKVFSVFWRDECGEGEESFHFLVSAQESSGELPNV